MFYEPTAEKMYDGGFRLALKESADHVGKFISTIKKELAFVNGKYTLKPQELPCWYGIPNIGFIFINSWADPEIEYKGHRFSCFYVEDAMWSWFAEENPHGTEDDFGKFMLDHKDDVYELCENIVFIEENGVSYGV